MKAHIKEKLQRILLEVEDVSGVPVDQITGRSRLKNTVIARNAYAYIARETTTASLKDIGSLIKRDHASVLYAHARVQSDPWGLSREIADQVKTNMEEESGLDYLNLLNVSISLFGLARYHAERSFDLRVGLSKL